MKKFSFTGIQLPHVFALLFGVILFCSALSYIIPSGTFSRAERQVGTMTRTVVIPGSYVHMEKVYSITGVFVPVEVEGKAAPVSLTQFFSAIPRGLEKTADIIFLIFLIGGVFGILQRTGTITAVLHALLTRYASSGPLLTIILMLGISVSGSTLGMGEEFIPLVPVFLYVARELGYDRIYGLALVMVAADIGFAASTTNPFTVQIAQGIAEVPIGSDIGFRVIFYLTCMAITIGYMLWYGRKIKRNPERSIMGNEDFHIKGLGEIHSTLHRYHIWTVAICGALFVGIIYAVQAKGWWLAEMSGGFLLMGIVAAILARLSVKETTTAFIKGMEEMVVAALVVGFAKGIQVVMEDGQIMDTLIQHASMTLNGLPRIVAAEGMLVFQTTLNFFIPSGSGQAATTMPLMAPLADLIGITRQAAVFAFTCGDGFSNTIIPTSGVLMAMLALADIPYVKWLRFMVPLFLMLMVASAIFLAVAVVYPMN
ncbi:MAG: YfcC family protein [Saprospiraceae bacterium]|nr:YfcC family protein [Saprospiraceae bacterium]